MQRQEVPCPYSVGEGTIVGATSAPMLTVCIFVNGSAGNDRHVYKGNR
jgi:hypothetical protein